MVTDNHAQTREADPSDALEDQDVDVAMQYLMEGAAPSERAKIEALDPPERRKLATLAYRDPDKAEQIMRYRRKGA